MKPIFQKDWHGIPFRSFATPDPLQVADERFYSAFYREFFRRFQSWDDLDPRWMTGKAEASKFVRSRIQDRPAPYLSFGCGLGAMERQLWNHGVRDLDLTESSPDALRWIGQEIPASHIHVGRFPACLPHGKKYGLIYFSAVDYCFDQKAWIELLFSTAGLLSREGRCLVVCPTFEPENGWISDLKHSLRGLKRKLSGPEQLWGYSRTARDFQEAFETAGYRICEQSVTPGGIFWIEATPKT